MNDKSKKINFFEDLAEKNKDGLYFTASIILPSNYQTDPPPLLSILGIKKESLSDIAISAMNALEEHGKSDKIWRKFKWRLWAFFEIQDMFTFPTHNASDFHSMSQLWYFYYESKYILIESILTGCNGFYQSSSTNLRLFLEFSVRQNYFYLRYLTNNDSTQLIKFFKTGITPNWSTLIKGALQKNAFTLPIKNRIEAHYEMLSNNFSHPYHHDFSPKYMNNSSTPEHTFIGCLCFWQVIDFILESVLWVYYGNFPMLLQPKDLIKKFGYNWPVGVFLDSSRGPIIKNALSKEDLSQFQNFSNQNESVISLNAWFDERSDLTTQEIEHTWNVELNGDFPKNAEIAKIKKLAKLRLLLESTALPSRIRDSEVDNIDFTNINFDLNAWKNYKKQKKRISNLSFARHKKGEC